MTSTPSPQADPAAFRDGRYGEPGSAYGEQPNDFLREQAAAPPPGEALCLAEGEGRNAVHLAQLGHRVLATDFNATDLSAVGLAKAEALARSRGVTIETSCGDLAAFQPAPQSVDLVVAIWMHLPPPLRAQVLDRAVAALRAGCHLILEAYTPRQIELGTGGPPQLELLWKPEALRGELTGLELLLLQERRRWIEEGPYHHGDSAVLQVLGRKSARPLLIPGYAHMLIDRSGRSFVDRCFRLSSARGGRRRRAAAVPSAVRRRHRHLHLSARRCGQR